MAMMTTTWQAIDTEAIKQRTDLLGLIGADTRLKKVAMTGGGEYAGACPFCGGRDRFLEASEAALWSDAGERARAYLHARGLTDETLRVWRVGLQPEESRHDPAEQWGFPHRGASGQPGWVRIARGIMLPWLLDGQLWQ